MADDQTTNALQQRPPTFRAAVMNMEPKIALAFFLVLMASLLLVFMAIMFNYLNAGAAALIASLVTLFVKMADNAVGYQYNSSSGSDKKDAAQVDVTNKLTDSVIASTPAEKTNGSKPWWGKLKPEEQAAITAAAPTDPDVQSFYTMAKVGMATPDDLKKLVAKGLLTQVRADEIPTS